MLRSRSNMRIKGGETPCQGIYRLWGQLGSLEKLDARGGVILASMRLRIITSVGEVRLREQFRHRSRIFSLPALAPMTSKKSIRVVYIAGIRLWLLSDMRGLERDMPRYQG